jgi:hypothetical protein
MDSFPNQTMLLFLNMTAMGRYPGTSGFKPKTNIHQIHVKGSNNRRRAPFQKKLKN